MYIREISRSLCAELCAKDAMKCIKTCDARAKLCFVCTLKLTFFFVYFLYTSRVGVGRGAVVSFVNPLMLTLFDRALPL